MSLNNLKIGLKSQNQSKFKNLFKLISTISSDENAKKHHSETSLVKWISPTQRLKLFHDQNQC
jgi:hypothetical protein